MSWPAALNLIESSPGTSGERLGALLGISRAAVHKGVTRLRNMGYPISAARGRGYRFSSAQRPYCGTEVERLLLGHGLSLPVQFHESCDSTNAQALRLEGELARGCLVLADAQSAGRGRHGRVWQSPPRANVYLTRLFACDIPAERANELSLVAGLAAARAVSGLGIDVGLKWPNDLWVQGCKLAGILVEGVFVESALQRAAVGIGINVNLAADALPAGLSVPATSLLALTQRRFDRSQVAAQLALQLETCYTEWMEQGLSNILNMYSQYDIIKGKSVLLISAEGELRGQALGLDQTGKLLIRNTNGALLALVSGEVSLRPCEG